MYNYVILSLTIKEKDMDIITNETNEMNEIKDTGMGLLWKPIGERVLFTRKGCEFEFVDYWPKQNKIRVWINQIGTGTFKVFKVEDFSVDELKEIEVWELLSDDQKKVIINGYIQAKAQEAIDAEERRVGRLPKAEHEGIPREIKCIRCGDMQVIAPANVLKYMEKAGQTVEEFVNCFKCSDCEPRHRGKQPSEKWLNLPREIHCCENGCTFVLKQHPSMTDKQAKDKGISFEEFVTTWKCKEHREKKPHHFTVMKEARLAKESKEGNVESNKPVKVTGKGHRGRQANPIYDGLPKGLTCCVSGCGFFQVQHPSISIKIAESKGVDLKEYMGNWKCKEHREKKVHPMSKEGRLARE
jgi:hypothetical protein